MELNDLKGEAGDIKEELQAVKGSLCILNKKVDDQNAYFMGKIAQHDMDIHILKKASGSAF